MTDDEQRAVWREKNRRVRAKRALLLRMAQWRRLRRAGLIQTHKEMMDALETTREAVLALESKFPNLKI